MTALRLLVLCLGGGASLLGAPAPLPIKPDLVVAADGSGDFKAIHEAVQSIPKDNRERRVIFVKDGVYAERVRVDAACVTLRRESRTGTRLEFSRPNTAPRDSASVAKFDLQGGAAVATEAGATLRLADVTLP